MRSKAFAVLTFGGERARVSHPIEKHLPIDVIKLMLENARDKTAEAGAQPPSFARSELNLQRAVARNDSADPGNGKTAFPILLCRARIPKQVGVDHGEERHCWGLGISGTWRRRHNKKPLAHAHLGRGDPHPLDFFHCLDHVIDQPLIGGRQRKPDLFRAPSQNRLAQLGDSQNARFRHGVSRWGPLMKGLTAV